MKHIWSVLCQKSSIDFENNLVSLFGCIEEINLVFNDTKSANDEKIVIPVDWQLVSFWTTDENENDDHLDLKIDFIDPSNNCLSSYENRIEIKRGMKRFRGRMTISGFQVTKNGRYFCRILKKTNDNFLLLSELPIDINISFNLPNA